MGDGARQETQAAVGRVQQAACRAYQPRRQILEGMEMTNMDYVSAIRGMCRRLGCADEARSLLEVRRHEAIDWLRAWAHVNGLPDKSLRAFSDACLNGVLFNSNA